MKTNWLRVGLVYYWCFLLHLVEAYAANLVISFSTGHIIAEFLKVGMTMGLGWLLLRGINVVKPISPRWWHFIWAIFCLLPEYLVYIDHITPD